MNIETSTPEKEGDASIEFRYDDTRLVCECGVDVERFTTDDTLNGEYKCSNCEAVYNLRLTMKEGRNSENFVCPVCETTTETHPHSQSPDDDIIRVICNECTYEIPVTQDEESEFTEKVTGSFVKEYFVNEFSPLVWEVDVENEAYWVYKDEMSREWLDVIETPETAEDLTDEDWLRKQVLNLFNEDIIVFNNKKAREYDFNGTRASDLRNKYEELIE
jgi:hypothetical protein